jgi:hypothetical protein
MLSSDDQKLADAGDSPEESEMSDYERRLENMDAQKKDNQDPTGNLKKEKRGFFKRKKK